MRNGLTSVSCDKNSEKEQSGLKGSLRRKWQLRRLITSRDRLETTGQVFTVTDICLDCALSTGPLPGSIVPMIEKKERKTSKDRTQMSQEASQSKLRWNRARDEASLLKRNESYRLELDESAHTSPDFSAIQVSHNLDGRQAHLLSLSLTLFPRSNTAMTGNVLYHLSIL